MDKVLFTPIENYFILFDIQFATAYGVNEAILFAKLYRLNEKLQGRTDEQGNKWVRLTGDEWAGELPFFSLKTILRTIEKAESSQRILSAVFGGRSKWYRCNPAYLPILTKPFGQNDQTHLVKMTKPFGQNDQLPKVLPKVFNNNNNNSLNEEFSKISTTYQNNIGALSSISTDIIKDIIKSIPEGLAAQWFDAAIKEAVRNNVRKLNYIEEILNRWIADGCMSDKKKRGKNNEISKKSNRSPDPKKSKLQADRDEADRAIYAELERRGLDPEQVGM